MAYIYPQYGSNQQNQQMPFNQMGYNLKVTTPANGLQMPLPFYGTAPSIRRAPAQYGEMGGGMQYGQPQQYGSMQGNYFGGGMVRPMLSGPTAQYSQLRGGGRYPMRPLRPRRPLQPIDGGYGGRPVYPMFNG